ncbi:MAG: AAA family ATPase [Chloroflexi bacterium]|nr:AAA family ATPase [Chloroflexota bacterium]
MTNVMTELSNWVSTLPYWEQAALEKIVTGVSLGDSDYAELLQFLLEDEALSEKKIPRPTLQFPQRDFAEPQYTGSLRLAKISNLKNVNALVQDQVLTFSNGITIIYGGNGSGKSGYARVLGCAGFTRGDREVLPDVTRPIDDTTTLSAMISLTDGTNTREIPYKVGDRCPELASLYTFDSTSVRVHLTQSNTLSFSPAGLAYLSQLSEITDRVREYLKAKIDEYSQPYNFSVLFQGDSEISRLIANLGPEADLRAISQLTLVTQEEEKHITELDLQIAQLKAQDIPSQVSKLNQKITDLEMLINRLKDAQNGLSDQSAEKIRNGLKNFQERQAIASQVGVDQFKLEHFSHVGSELWYEFVKAARLLANAEQTPSHEYPQPNDRCLLCQQPLSEEARSLLIRLWNFLASDAQSKLVEADAALVGIRQAVESIPLEFFNDQSVSYRHLQEHNVEILRKVGALITRFQERRKNISNAIANHTSLAIFPPLAEDSISEIELVISKLKNERTELGRKDPSSEILQLEAQLRNLQHRVILREHYTEIENYVHRRIWAQRAGRVGGNTRHITKKHNDLFRELVTDRYIELFEKILQELGRPLKVKVVTKGRKGETYKQIVLETDPSVPLDKGIPDKVLSEGEKRAVALADFLTEIALDTMSSAIVLDDPVTSLDLEWRNLVATILANEAKRRQVIVFTHDLPFLYFLKKYAEQNGVDIEAHWIKRGDNDGKPGYVFLNNSPALERDYKKTTYAREKYSKAKDAPATEQQSLLRDGFGALRTSYEAFIVFELFNEVVMRFDERISFGRLSGIVWDQSIVDAVVAKCESLSRYIEGHLHSDAFAAEKPTPAMLLKEVEAFEELQRKMKKAKK